MSGPYGGFGGALDRAIGLFSPERQARRMAARDRVRSLYAAAKPTGDAGGWLPLDDDVNHVIRGSESTVRARVRQLIRDFPYFQRVVQVREAFVIGNGIRLQSRMYLPSSFRLDRERNDRIEEAWAEWSAGADLSGKLTFTDLQALADKQLLECGEYFFIKRAGRDRFALQPVETDRLTDMGASVASDAHGLERGIEYDKATGKVIAYHFDDGGYARRTVRVPAEQVLHGFETLRPGQMHGISPLVSCVMVAGDLAELLDSELDAARLQSKVLGFVQSNDLAGFQGSRVSQKRDTEFLENGTLEYLRTGDTVTLAKMDRQGATFEPFLKFNLRTLCVGSRITYELMTSDYDQISYSNLRGIRMDFSRLLQPVQRHHVNWLCRPAFEAWLRWASLKDPRLWPSDGTLRPWNHLWIPPGMESADPLKEIQAFVEEVNLGVRSPQEIAARRGRDLSDIMDEIKEAKSMAEERGLTLGEVLRAMAALPATPGEGESNA